MEKKYEITKETMKIIDENGDEKTLHRIKALKDFGNVKKGDFILTTKAFQYNILNSLG